MFGSCTGARVLICSLDYNLNWYTEEKAFVGGFCEEDDDGIKKQKAPATV